MPEQTTSRKPHSIRRLRSFEHGLETVNCWFDIESGQLCFRRKRARRVQRATLFDVYSQVILGQKALFPPA